jgi:Cupin domain/Tetratricopeptide repeat
VPDRKPTRPAQAIHIDEIEGLAGPDTLTWHPVRMRLGIRAFGTNAYTAAEPGLDVVEPHTESPVLAHEELYFVARGRATFTIDGEEIDAPAGTYVFVPDPASHRHAVAAEAGTTVLSFGGPPTFQPSAWERYFEAAALRDTDPARARKILDSALREFPQSAGVRYELACWEATQGHGPEALRWLREALDRDPEVAEAAREDDDFTSLRGDPEFGALTGV